MIKFSVTAECNHFLITNDLKKNPKIYNQKVTTFCSEKKLVFSVDPQQCFLRGRGFWSRSKPKMDPVTCFVTNKIKLISLPQYVESIYKTFRVRLSLGGVY